MHIYSYYTMIATTKPDIPIHAGRLNDTDSHSPTSVVRGSPPYNASGGGLSSHSSQSNAHLYGKAACLAFPSKQPTPFLQAKPIGH